jgi:hypothetical protein
MGRIRLFVFVFVWYAPVALAQSRVFLLSSCFPAHLLLACFAALSCAVGEFSRAAHLPCDVMQLPSATPTCCESTGLLPCPFAFVSDALVCARGAVSRLAFLICFFGVVSPHPPLSMFPLPSLHLWLRQCTNVLPQYTQATSTPRSRTPRASPACGGSDYTSSWRPPLPLPSTLTLPRRHTMPTGYHSTLAPVSVSAPTNSLMPSYFPAHLARFAREQPARGARRDRAIPA